MAVETYFSKLWWFFYLEKKFSIVLKYFSHNIFNKLWKWFFILIFIILFFPFNWTRWTLDIWYALKNIHWVDHRTSILEVVYEKQLSNSVWRTTRIFHEIDRRAPSLTVNFVTVAELYIVHIHQGYWKTDSLSQINIILRFSHEKQQKKFYFSSQSSRNWKKLTFESLESYPFLSTYYTDINRSRLNKRVSRIRFL